LSSTTTWMNAVRLWSSQRRLSGIPGTAAASVESFGTAGSRWSAQDWRIAMSRSAVACFAATATHPARLNMYLSRAGDLSPAQAVVVHRDDCPGPRGESFQHRRLPVSLEHGTDAFPTAFVLPSRGASIERETNRAKAEIHACCHAAPSIRNLSDAKTASTRAGRCASRDLCRDWARAPAER